VLAAIKAGDHHVRFPSGLDSNATVHTRQDKALTVSANLPPVFSGQSQLGPHGDLPGDLHIPLRQLRIFADGFSGEAEEDMNALQGYLLRGDHPLKGS
jgi:hypothetical protein